VVVTDATSTNVNVSLDAVEGHPTWSTKELAIEEKVVHPSVAIALKVKVTSSVVVTGVTIQSESFFTIAN